MSFIPGWATDLDPEDLEWCARCGNVFTDYANVVEVPDPDHATAGMMLIHRSCAYPDVFPAEAEGRTHDGRLNFFLLPDNVQESLRNICSADHVQAAEDGRLQS
jgi:hypothetical protein